MDNQSIEKPVHLIFVGPIDQAGVQRLGQGLNAALNDQATSIHLMLQSAGGTVGDGVCLYEIFSCLPVALTAYNCGAVCSAATIAYLGAPKRVTSGSGLFMIHPTNYSPQFASSGTLGRLADAAILEDNRIEAIYNKHLALTEDQKAAHKTGDLWLSAEIAKEVGLATDIGDYRLPPGTRPYFI
jgi:ATP-dependent protease ClpP protease subunit